MLLLCPRLMPSICTYVHKQRGRGPCPAGYLRECEWARPWPASCMLARVRHGRSALSTMVDATKRTKTEVIKRGGMWPRNQKRISLVPKIMCHAGDHYRNAGSYQFRCCYIQALDRSVLLLSASVSRVPLV